jgi:hypothetical protein
MCVLLLAQRQVLPQAQRQVQRQALPRARLLLVTIVIIHFASHAAPVLATPARDPAKQPKEVLVQLVGQKPTVLLHAIFVALPALLTTSFLAKLAGAQRRSQRNGN